MAVSSDGNRLYLAGVGTNTVCMTATATDNIERAITGKAGQRSWGIAITPDGSTICTANGLSESKSVISGTCRCVVTNVKAGRGLHAVVESLPK